MITKKQSGVFEYTEKIINEPNFKGAVLRSLYRLAYYKQKYLSSETVLTICKENIHIQHVVMITRKDFYLIDALNKKMDQLKQAGLVEYWRMWFIDMNFVKAKAPSDPQVMTFDQMQGIIYILLIGYAVSAVAFISELLFCYCSK